MTDASDDPRAAGRAVTPEPSVEVRRSRPQYGEYATPEEQRARIQQPAPWQLEAVAPVMTDAVDPGIPSDPPVAAEKRQRPVDRIITFALLAYGLVNVISSVPAFLDYGAYAETILAAIGAEAEVSDPAGGRAWGIAAVIVLTIGWCATAVVSVWSMRAGRLTWWIPLVGGVVFIFLAGALMTIPLMNDPAVWQAVFESAGGAG